MCDLTDMEILDCHGVRLFTETHVCQGQGEVRSIQPTTNDIKSTRKTAEMTF